MTIEEIIERQKAKERALEARLDELEAEDRALYEFTDRSGGGPIVVHRNPSKPGTWRVTWFAENGDPAGHTEAATRLDALRRAPDYGAVLSPAAADAEKCANCGDACSGDTRSVDQRPFCDADCRLMFAAGHDVEAACFGEDPT